MPATNHQSAETVPLFESGGISLYMSLGGALLLLLWGARQGLGSISQLGATAFGLLGVYFFINHLRRRKNPVMTLTPRGLLLPGMETALPWADVADYTVKTKGFLGMATYTTFLIRLRDETGDLSAISDARISYHEEQNLIIVKLMRFRLETREVLQLFHAYLQAA